MAPYSPPPPQVSPTDYADVLIWGFWILGVTGVLALIATIAKLALDSRHVRLQLPGWVADFHWPTLVKVRFWVCLLAGTTVGIWGIDTGHTLLLLATSTVALPIFLGVGNQVEAGGPIVIADPIVLPTPADQLGGADREWYDLWATHLGIPPEESTMVTPATPDSAPAPIETRNK